MLRIDYNLLINHKTSVMIGSPTYTGEFYYRYVQSLLKTCKDLEQHDIDYQIEFAVCDNFIHRARNMIVDKFLKSKCTHLMMIDADQGWDPTAIRNMISHNKRFIAGAVRKKIQGEDYALQIYVNKDQTPVVENSLISTLMIGAAFTLVKREAFELLKCNNIKRKDYYSFYDDTYSTNGELIGEDVTFCNRWRNVGGDIYIMPDIDIYHGEHLGNYHRYLMRQPKPSSIVTIEEALDNLTKTGE